MVQGTLKKSTGKPSGATSKRPSALGPKRLGNRTIAPKKASLIKQQKVTKVCYMSIYYILCICSSLSGWKGGAERSGERRRREEMPGVWS
ncbi:hypothetical protein BJX61DRAFT_493246 [Aspergillus egyptiacus]|nr:hypothetical protein BJX61DRAFT_493246 [Aspergillus egyptiacus]